jgi:hypothetical protein
MKKHWIKLLIVSGLAIILYYLLFESIWYLLNKISPTKKSISLGIALYYGKILFSFLIFASVYAWLITNKIIKLFLIIMSFIIFIIYWYPTLFIYPYKISLLIIVSVIFYGILHLLMFFRMKNN